MAAYFRTVVTDAGRWTPVAGSGLGLGTWQGFYLIEHRNRPHRRAQILHALNV